MCHLNYRPSTDVADSYAALPPFGRERGGVGVAVRYVYEEMYIPTHRLWFFFFCSVTSSPHLSAVSAVATFYATLSPSLREKEGGFVMAVRYIGEEVHIPTFSFVLTFHLSFWFGMVK